MPETGKAALLLHLGESRYKFCDVQQYIKLMRAWSRFAASKGFMGERTGQGAAAAIGVYIRNQRFLMYCVDKAGTLGY